MHYLFALINIGIFCGYGFLAFFVAPHLKVNLRRTKIGGALFFLLCGLTHLDLAYHGWYNEPADWASFHMMAIHIPQLIAVWAFVSGLYTEFVKGEGVWPVDPSFRDKHRTS